MEFKVIGLLGVKGAGKDTAAAFLVERQNYVRVAFADKLYREVADAFGVTVEFLGNRQTKELPLSQMALANCADKAFVECVAEELDCPVDSAFLAAHRSPRLIMQLWGTEYRRKRGVDSYWLDEVSRIIDSRPHDNFVITDVRFPNEAEFVKARGGRLVRVRRPHLEAQESASRAAGSTAGHDSETQMLSYPVDRELLNIEGQTNSLRDALEHYMDQASTNASA